MSMENLASHEHSKAELVKELKGLINDAESMPIKELCRTGDYNSKPDLKYPQTKSEHIVFVALDLLLSHEWVDDDPILDEITSVLSQLDTSVDKSWAWQELFRLI